MSETEKKQISEKEETQNEQIREMGQILLEENKQNYRIHLLSIIGEVEGHEVLSANSKTTKYEHVLPKLAEIENSSEVDGVLILLNTVGGDVEAGLAIAEMVASMSKPSVSLDFRRWSFNWSSDGSFSRLFIYCSFCYYDDSSGQK